MRVLIFLTILIVISSFKMNPLTKTTKTTKLYSLNNLHTRLSIKIFNIVDIQPTSISKFVQYKLFINNIIERLGNRFSEDLYEKNLHFSLDIFVFSICCLYIYYNYYIYNLKINKIPILSEENEKEKEICLSKFNIFISFISYLLFKDVLSAC